MSRKAAWLKARRARIREEKGETEYAKRTPENFKAAYDAVNSAKQANDYVKVSDMRDELGWTKKEFDAMIERLRGSGTIQLNLGDQHLLTKREYENGYTDAMMRHFGMTYGALTWTG